MAVRAHNLGEEHPETLESRKICVIAQLRANKSPTEAVATLKQVYKA